ncbi:MAG: class IV adenylate cyclase [Candidatus Nanoarchaeia archaeon]
MKEVELKILEINIKDIDKRIISLGGNKKGKFLIKSAFFDFPDGRIKKNKELLRLRTVGDKVELVYKQNSHNEHYFKVCDEHQVELDSFENAELLLAALGLKKIRYYEKYRTSYTLKDLKIEIDELPGVPAFLEIEGEKKEIEHTVVLLGFSMQDTTTMTGSDVLKKYGKQKSEMRF